MEGKMGSISIQGVDEQLTALLKQQAGKARTSVFHSKATIYSGISRRQVCIRWLSSYQFSK